MCTCVSNFMKDTNCYYSLIKKHRSDPHNQWRAFMILLPCLKYPAAQMKWGQKAVAAQSLTCQMQQRNQRQPGGNGQTLPSRRFPCPEIGPRGGAYLLHDWRHHCNLLQWASFKSSCWQSCSKRLYSRWPIPSEICNPASQTCVPVEKTKSNHQCWSKKSALALMPWCIVYPGGGGEEENKEK